MSDTIGREELAAMLREAAAVVTANHELLTALDTATGDGDHGTTMVRSMQALTATLDQGAATAAELLHAIGWAIMSADGGSTGPLLGSFFMGMAEGAGGEEWDTFGLAVMLTAGIEKMGKQSRAMVGDRTMMDAMVPALEALNAVAATGSIATALVNAAEAAALGAAATTEMKARFGRARNLGDRVLGHRDPGAVSVSLIFRGLHDGLLKHRKG